MASISKQLTEFAVNCREAGLKATHQRIEIYRELIQTTEHPDAETICQLVRERIPSLSLDTVYRTLHMFEERGIISRIGSTGERARFDADTLHHCHFICSRCGLIADVQCDELAGLSVPDAACPHGQIETVHVELRGCCEACRRAEEG